MGTSKKKTRTKVRKFLKTNPNPFDKNTAAMLGLSTMDGSNIKPKPETYKWESLADEYKLAARDLVQQLANCNSIMERFEEPLSKASDLNAELIGLIRSYEDQVNDLIATAERHKDGGDWRKGKIRPNDIDAEMEYLSIMGKYIAIEEATARLTSQAMTGIMSSIMTDPRFKDDEIAKKALSDLKELNATLDALHNPDANPETLAEANIKLDGVINGN